MPLEDEGESPPEPLGGVTGVEGGYYLGLADLVEEIGYQMWV